MIDIHTHIIDGIDDGAQNMEDSLALLKMAAESGTTDCTGPIKTDNDKAPPIVG